MLPCLTAADKLGRGEAVTAAAELTHWIFEADRAAAAAAAAEVARDWSHAAPCSTMLQHCQAILQSGKAYKRHN